MFRSLSSLSIAAIYIVALVPAGSPRNQTATDEAQTLPRFSSASRIVNVDVIVTDHKGRHVQGLSKDDFQTFDDGHPEWVAFFSTRDDRARGRNEVDALALGEYTNNPRKLGLPDAGTTVILFDTVNSPYLSQAYSLGRIRVFLRQLQPDDRVGIYVLNENGLKVVYHPSQPASVLLDAMQRYDDAHSAGRGSKSTAAAENSTGLEQLDRFLRGKYDHRPLDRCDPERFPVTIAAFQEIARSTEGLGGRKAVIWVTEQMPLPFAEENALDLARGEFCGMRAYDPDLLLEDPANLIAKSKMWRLVLQVTGNAVTREQSEATYRSLSVSVVSAFFQAASNSLRTS